VDNSVDEAADRAVGSALRLDRDFALKKAAIQHQSHPFDIVLNLRLRSSPKLLCCS